MRGTAEAELALVEQGDVEEPPAEEPAPALCYGSVDEVVSEFIVPVSGARSRSREHLRLDPATGMSVWLRDHADHHLGVLWDPGGVPVQRVVVVPRPLGIS